MYLDQVNCYNADIDQILLEAQHRWLRPAEICEILRNYTKFRIASEPGNRPPSMISKTFGLGHCYFLYFNDMI